jgi:type VI secretion system protein ImpC
MSTSSMKADGPAEIDSGPSGPQPRRVPITYDIETGGRIELCELPFVIGIFADLSADRDRASLPMLRERRFVTIDQDSFDAVLKQVGPRVALDQVDNVLPGGGGKLTGRAIVFEALSDFEPLRVLEEIDLAAPLLRQRQALDAASQERAAIDRALSAQLSLIMHGERFRDLEATWRGIHRLVSRSGPGAPVLIRLFDARLTDLQDDLAKAVVSDQSTVWKRVCDDERDSFGGSPFGLLVGDYAIGPGAQDMEFLERMSAAAAAARAPFITAASPRLFDLASFRDLPRPRALGKIFESVDLSAWRHFRECDDSRYVALVLPRVLVRLPHAAVPATGSDEVIALDGDVAGPDGRLDIDRLLWGNAAYILAERIMTAFARTGTTASICGVEGGGLVDALPAYRPVGEVAEPIGDLLCPTEVAITDQRRRELDDLGFISLCHRKGTDQAAFFSERTANVPRKYASEEATTAARAKAGLTTVLLESRFAHYIDAILRVKLGSFMTRANVEVYLNAWISRYVSLDDDAPAEVVAVLPLRKASVVVGEVPGQPGAYQTTVLLELHPRIEALTSSVCLAPFESAGCRSGPRSSG